MNTLGRLAHLFVVTALLMVMAREDTGHEAHQAMDEMQSHEDHGMDMGPADTAGFTDGSIYQVSSSWVTQDDQQINISDLKGQFVVMAMTYTSCEFSCPLIVADMKKIISKIPDRQKQHVRLVLLSIDPENDTPAVMKAFAQKTRLAPDQWTLLKGDAGDVLEIAALLGVRYKKMPDGEYAHSNIITLLNPEGEVIHQQNGLGPDLSTSTIKILQDKLSPEA